MIKSIIGKMHHSGFQNSSNHTLYDSLAKQDVTANTRLPFSVSGAMRRSADCGEYRKATGAVAQALMLDHRTLLVSGTARRRCRF
jgi:hypothetical protein